MNGSHIPWDAPATLGLKGPGSKAYVPEMVGLTLNEAIDRAVDPDLRARHRPCIWVEWNGELVLLERRRIFQLACEADRPARLGQSRLQPR